MVPWFGVTHPWARPNRANLLLKPVLDLLNTTRSFLEWSTPCPSIFFHLILVFFMSFRDEIIYYDILGLENGILLPKLFFTRTICSNSERSEQFFVAECFFNLFLEVSHIIRTIRIQIGKNIVIYKHAGKVRKINCFLF